MWPAHGKSGPSWDYPVGWVVLEQSLATLFLLLGGGSRVLLGLCQGETFVLENIHPYPLVIGLGSGQLRTGYPFCTRQTLSNLVYALLIVVCHTNNYLRENFNFWFWFSQMDQFLVLLSSMSYIMTPYPPPSGDIVQNLNVGDRLLGNVKFSSYAGETLFILFFFLEYTILSVWII